MFGAEACSTTPPFRFFCFARHVEEEIAFLANSFLFKLWLKHLCEKRPRGGGEKTEEPYHRDHLGGGGWSVRDILWDVFLARFWGFFIFEISRGRNERDICKDEWINTVGMCSEYNLKDRMPQIWKPWDVALIMNRWFVLWDERRKIHYDD